MLAALLCDIAVTRGGHTASRWGLALAGNRRALTSFGGFVCSHAATLTFSFQLSIVSARRSLGLVGSLAIGTYIALPGGNALWSVPRAPPAFHTMHVTLHRVSRASRASGQAPNTCIP